MASTGTVASIELTADYSALARGLRAAAGMVGQFASSTRGALTSVAAAPGGALLSLGRSMGALASFGIAKRGLDMMVDMGRGVFDFERKLTRFGIATRQGAGELAVLRRETRATSLATGVDANVVLDSARAYVDLAGAQNSSIEKMKILARAGQASEAEGKDLAGMMYQLTRSMKVADDQMENTMGGLINQAKDGAIEAKQMAAEFAGMMPIFARFGVTGREGAIQLGAMYQVTRDGFDSAAQASTGMIRLMAGFQRHASRFKGWGVEVFKPGSKHDLREISDIMAQIKKSPLSKDIEGLIKAFGRSEAWRTFELLNEAPERLKELEESGRANNVIQRDLATYLESTAGRLDAAGEKMKNAFAEVLTPERVDQIVGGITSIANSIGPLMKAIGGVSSAFGAFIHTVAKAKHWAQGNSKLKLTDEEQDLVDAAEVGWTRKWGREHRLTPAELARAKEIKKRKTEYDSAIGSIMDLEDDFGPTDASIKQAIRLGHSWYGSGPKMPGDQSSIAYLKAREREISDARYKRLDAEVSAEEQKARSEQYAKEHIKPIVDDAVKKLGAMLGGVTMPKVFQTTVSVDGNPVARASGNATDRRRK